jgi:cytochrome c
MADAPPPPRTGRLAVVVLVLAMIAVIAGVLLRSRPDSRPGPVSAIDSPPADPQPIAYYLARADPVRGEAYFSRCSACHTIGPGGAASIGPNLYGVMGSPLAARPGFAYSPALREHGGSWDWETTNRFLHSPRVFAPGTRMTFAGVGDPQNRADLMLYLNSQGGTLAPPAGAQ